MVLKQTATYGIQIAFINNRLNKIKIGKEEIISIYALGMNCFKTLFTE